MPLKPRLWFQVRIQGPTTELRSSVSPKIEIWAITSFFTYRDGGGFSEVMRSSIWRENYNPWGFYLLGEVGDAPEHGKEMKGLQASIDSFAFPHVK